MLVSIGIVHSTSALRICFVGDTPAKIGVSTLRSSRSLDILSVLFSLFTQRFQVLKSSCQEVLSSRVRGMSHWLLSCCVCCILCGKCGSDTHPMHRSIAGHFTQITKTVSRWMLPRWYFREYPLLVAIQWHFTEFNYWFSSRQLFDIPTSQVTLKWPTWLKKKEFWRALLDCHARSEILTALPSRNTVCDTACTEPRRVTHATLSQSALLSLKNSILTKFISISLFR